MFNYALNMTISMHMNMSPHILEAAEAHPLDGLAREEVRMHLSSRRHLAPPTQQLGSQRLPRVRLGQPREDLLRRQEQSWEETATSRARICPKGATT